MVKPALKNWVLAVLLLATLASFGQRSGKVNDWYDVGEFVYNNSNANPNDLIFHILQYDSGYYWLDMGGAARPFNVFSAGNVFDLTHDLWFAVPDSVDYSLLPLRSNDSFSWDSLKFTYFYLRGNSDTSLVDTLFIYYYSNFDEKDTQLVLSPVVFGIIDTCNAAKPRFTDFTEPGEGYFRRDTILLRITDTASINIGRVYKTSVKKSFNGNAKNFRNFYGLFGYSVTFKPGFTAPAPDTLFDMRNNSAKTNLFGLYCVDVFRPVAGPPEYYDFLCNRRFSQNSFFLYKGNRYGGIYNGQEGFYPGIFDSSQEPWIDHQLLKGAVYVRANSSIFSAVKATLPKVIKLWPNPVSPGEVVSIEGIEDLSEPVSIVITDMLGRQVLSETVVNTYTIPAPLAYGIYNVVITAMSNSSSYSTKLIVINR